MQWALRKVVVIGVALPLAACGGGGSDDASPDRPDRSTAPETSTTTTTLPVPLSPAEQAFLAGLESSGIELGEGEEDLSGAVVGSALNVCDHLDSAAEMESQAAETEAQAAGLPADDPAAAGLIEEGADIAAEARSIRDTHLRLAQIDAGMIYDRLGSDAGDQIISLMTQHLCPEHAGFTYQPNE